MQISVIGSGRASEDVLNLAEELGREIARRNHVLVCGGRGGVMEAACRGAREEGGITVGILPGEMRDEANPYVDVVIPTGLGEARNALVVRAGDAVIAVAGGWGTLSEISLAKKMGKPVVGLTLSGGWAEELARRGEIEGAGSPKEAVKKAERLVGYR
ncbi:TIGR00725 family protein [Methanopyrus sp.]